ncbi:MAG: peptide ABC transporter substrate-binding protein [Gemmatimonadetes bacterium]|nr:peptide ABC transporter substrate-binding protein [Gemmatimonadota bacterium]
MAYSSVYRACLATLALAGCGAPARPGGSTVFFASGADLQSVNPLFTVHPLAKQVQKHVLLMTLVAYDSAMVPRPRLASFEWTDRRRALVFHLRRDITWSDGRPTWAGDVKWTLDMAREPAIAYPRARDLSAVTAVEAPDSFTVRVRFAQAQPTFPDVLTDLSILPAHAFAGVKPSEVRAAPFSRSPIGNGPFEFDEYRPNQRWVFRRREGFPADLGVPNVDRLVVVVVDEPTTKLAALTSGELDFAGINPAHASFVRADPRLTVREYPVQLVNAVIWNLRRPPFDDPAVRTALDLAIDRQLVVDAYIFGFGAIAGGPVPAEHPWYEPVPPPAFDTTRSRTVLDSAGWVVGPDGIRARGGRRLQFTLLTVGTGDNALEQMLQAQFRSVGADMTIRQLELATFLAVVQGSARDFDALLTSIPGDLSLGYVAATLGGRGAGPLAYPGYRSAAFDAALDRAADATTEEALRAAWHEAQRVVARDRPVAWLYHARGLQGINRRMQGVAIDLRGELANVSRWSVSTSAIR